VIQAGDRPTAKTTSDHPARLEEALMATSLVIEEESGTCTGYVHPHNGYYAGDFSLRTAAATVETSATVLPFRAAVLAQRPGHSAAA
jgi:hypothetical protein